MGIGSISQLIRPIFKVLAWRWTKGCKGQTDTWWVGRGCMVVRLSPPHRTYDLLFLFINCFFAGQVPWCTSEGSWMPCWWSWVHSPVGLCVFGSCWFSGLWPSWLIGLWHLIELPGGALWATHTLLYGWGEVTFQAINIQPKFTKSAKLQATVTNTWQQSELKENLIYLIIQHFGK